MRGSKTVRGGRLPRPSAAVRPVLVALSLLGVCQATQSPADTRQPSPTLHFETGHVVVEGGVAGIDLPAGWRYLQQDEARYVVENVWRNPRRLSTRGLILPPAQDEWGGIIVSYIASGFVADGDADLDADVLLAELRDQLAAANPLRARIGRQEAELVGWADPPRYDGQGKKLSWGKLLRVGSGKPTVNFEARVLGAEGMLSLQAVADADRLDALRAGMQHVLDGTELAPGLRYADHDPTRHRVATTSLAGLIVDIRARVPLFRVVLKPVIALVVVILALFASRQTSRGSVSDTDR